MTRKVLITGGSGFVGREIAKQLGSAFHVVIGARNQEMCSEASRYAGCEWVPLDVASEASVNDALGTLRPEVVVHAAATKYVQTAEQFALNSVDVNVRGAINVCHLARFHGVRTIVGLSTDKAAAPHWNLYGLCKSLLEQIFLGDYDESIEIVCTRFGNVAWSTGSVFHEWARMEKDSRRIGSTGPSMRRFFFGVEGAAAVVQHAILNSSWLHGSILVPRLRAATIADVLAVWTETRGTSWFPLPGRPGDRPHEYLVGPHEGASARSVELDGMEYLQILPGRKGLARQAGPYGTMHAPDLSTDEIRQLLPRGLTHG